MNGHDYLAGAVAILVQEERRGADAQDAVRRLHRGDILSRIRPRKVLFVLGSATVGLVCGPDRYLAAAGDFP